MTPLIHNNIHYYSVILHSFLITEIPTFTGMAGRYREFSKLNLPSIEQEVLAKWSDIQAFEKSVGLRNAKKPFVFYEGPPSANGLPGIHHVISRTLKDLVCRYKTMRGYQVKRKGE